MKKNVLIIPCGSEIGLEIYRSLYASTHFELFGGSSIDDHGKFVYKNYIGGIPFVEASDFLHHVNKLIKEHKIDFIIPAHDSVVLKLAQASADGELACEVVTSPLETCEISRSKLKTYQHFTGKIPTPHMYRGLEELDSKDFPIFLKPDIGQGSKGINIAKSREDIQFYRSKDQSLLLLEYLPGKEYTVDCFTDKSGRLLFSEGRGRNRIANGISVNSSTVEDKRFKELANIINKTLSFRGVWFFQLKENSSGELILMEIAPRVAGTMGLSRNKGVNLVLLSLFDRLDYPVEVFANDYDIVIDRALGNTYRHNISYRHVYLDFDDLVIFEAKVNPAVLAFVFQCMNNKVQIHLLTRHGQDLERSLKHYRLDKLFDEIIWIKNGEPKHQYIKHADSIFIDDSFAERQEVQKSHGIPVFDAHMLEALMERF